MIWSRLSVGALEMTDFPALISTFSDQPLLLGLTLFGATFIVEDVATVAAGVLVARTGADPVAAVLGVILGTAAGDLALYALGRWGAETRLGRKLRARPDVRRTEAWIAGRVLTLTFAARFMPGFRLPIFTASGLVAAPLALVAAIIALTTPIWTGALFALARCAGEAGASQLVSAALPLGLLFSLGALVLHRSVPATA
jgi:membrane protein DedA with SNARE-associated domain